MGALWAASTTGTSAAALGGGVTRVCERVNARPRAPGRGRVGSRVDEQKGPLTRLTLCGAGRGGVGG